jgi:hypothetical protein
LTVPGSRQDALSYGLRPSGFPLCALGVLSGCYVFQHAEQGQDGLATQGRDALATEAVLHPFFRFLSAKAVLVAAGAMRPMTRALEIGCLPGYYERSTSQEHSR